jgi:cytochrome b6-f complex iron-sulfur subunit
MTPLQFALGLALVCVAAWVPFMAVSALRKSRAETAAWSVGTGASGLDAPEPRPMVRGADVSDVTRRQFLNRAMGITVMVGLVQFGLASLDFLYPRLRGGFGAKVTAGDADEIKTEISTNREPKFIPDGRFYLSVYEGDPKAAANIPAYKAANVDKTGMMALYRKCVHLGCSVPWCPPAKWFECPCHGSKYSINGEYRDGPAPRSLDQFRIEITGGKIVVDTSTIIQGAPRGTKTSQPQPEGAHCVNIKEG